jgi:putative ABC transport system substrate-binding protein
MRRREFITLLTGAAAWPLAARAQQDGQVRRVAMLLLTAEGHALLGAELQKLGWIEERNLRLDVRYPRGDFNRARAYAAELVKLAPDAIYAGGGVAVDAVLQETKSIPIIAVLGDFNEKGVVKNVAHPEGNITGLANTFGSLGGKWLELLKEAAPNITHVAYLTRSGNLTGDSYQRYAVAAAQALGVRIETIGVGNAADIKAAIERCAAEPNGGLLVDPGMLAIAPLELMRLAEEYRLPAISGAPNGGLMSYSSAMDLVELARSIASYIDRILRGAKISDLPVQYPTKFRLAINLKAAKAIGLAIPEALLARADEVIE